MLSGYALFIGAICALIAYLQTANRTAELIFSLLFVILVGAAVHQTPWTRRVLDEWSAPSTPAPTAACAERLLNPHDAFQSACGPGQTIAKERDPSGEVAYVCRCPAARAADSAPSTGAP